MTHREITWNVARQEDDRKEEQYLDLEVRVMDICMDTKLNTGKTRHRKIELYKSVKVHIA